MTALAFKRRVVRAAKPSWSYAPISGEGAKRHGGRFNAKGVAALYTSFDFKTCANEVRFSLNTDPYTFYYIDVESTRIADLSTHQGREPFGISLTDLECPNWESELYRGLEPSSHKVAKSLQDDGFHGMIVQSFAPQAAPGDLNLVLWTWKPSDKRTSNADEAAWVTVLNADLLPQDQSSWSK